MREYKIVVADPAKNITVFVLDKVESREERVLLSQAIMASADLKAEQVGFVIPPPEYDAASSFDESAGKKKQQGLWRLEMMGGEFCGNAGRAFGLFVARKLGLSGEIRLPVEISGSREPLSVYINTRAGTAEVNMPLPLAAYSVAYNGAELPVFVFEGITHIIAPDIPPAKDTFFALKKIIDDAGPSPEALGVMFWDSGVSFMDPAVYVYATESLIFESSCGSGSAALALWQSSGLLNGEARGEVAQPGGIITTRVVKRGGELLSLSIGGEVALGETRSFFL